MSERGDPARRSQDPDLERSRLTVAFRLFLAIPHLIWLAVLVLARDAGRDRELDRDAHLRHAVADVPPLPERPTSATRRTSSPI